MADIEKLCAVEDEGIEGVICGRAIYSGDLDFAQAQARADELEAARPSAEPDIAMLAKRIIPCLDVTGGRVVKGVNFVELRDAGDPVEIAARYNEQGADELTFLDITATSDGRDLILHIIEAVASQVFIPLTVGGGVRTVEDVRRLLNAGADKTSFNSAAIANPAGDRRRLRTSTARSASWWRSTPSAAAARTRPRAAPAGTSTATAGASNTGLDAVQWAAEMARRGAGEILLTSMDRDGTKSGFDLALTRAVSDAVSVPVIASGGVGNLRPPGRRRPEGRRRRGAGRQHLPLRRVHRRRRPRRRMAERGIPVRL